MSDDFDDDLYNIYNGAGQEDSYNDEDLYGDDPVTDVVNEKQDVQHEDQSAPNDKQEEEQNGANQDDYTSSSTTQQQYNNYPQGNNNWAFQQGNAYQQYMATYQRHLQQQMAMNPYQMQQMMQRQMMSQQQHYNKPHNKNNNQNNNHHSIKKENDQQGNEDKKKDSSDEGKMFVGGLNWETTDESLREYFSQFGEVLECNVMRDPMTQRSRGFAFMTMKDNATIDKIVAQSDHNLDGKRIDPKKAIPREEQDKTEKIFVGGISQEVNEEEFKEFFGQFGTVIDATLMMERDTGRPRGFGFITFESSDGVDEALRNPNLSIKGKVIEVKKAMPKNKQQQQQQQNRMNNNATPVLNPNFRGGQNMYMPNSRYAGGASFGNMMPNMYNAGNMYPYNNMAAVAAAAAYYGGAGSQQQPRHNNSRNYNNNGSTRGDDDRKNRGGGAVHASQSRNSQHYRPY